jgi:hypothetical protein
MNRLIQLALLLGCVACATITDIPYNAKDNDTGTGDIKAMINANVVQGCIVEMEDGPSMLAIKYACTSGIGNSVLRFDQIADMKLQQSGEWYRVMVTHKTADEFSWTSKSRADMERLFDAIHAVSQAGAMGGVGEPPAPTL